MPTRPLALPKTLAQYLTMRRRAWEIRVHGGDIDFALALEDTCALAVPRLGPSCADLENLADSLVDNPGTHESEWEEHIRIWT